MRVLIPGASLRDRAALPSPLRGLVPSGGHPSPLRSLRSLRAPLGPAVRIAHRRLPGRRRRALLPLRGSSAYVSSSTPLPRLSLPAPPASARASAWRTVLACCTLARRLASPAFAFAIAAWLARAPSPARSVAAAAALRFHLRDRFPRRSVPWIGSSLRPSAARLSHPTQRAAEASPTPCQYTGITVQRAPATLHRPEFVGLSVYRFDIRS